MDKDQKAVWGWALYDWANSAFATTVMAGFFPIFFKQYWSQGTDVNLSTAQLGIGNSIAGLLMALLAPVLGAVADRASAKKKFLLAFAGLGVLSTAGLYWVGQGEWAFAIFVYAISIVGFAGANVFYDALLLSVAAPERVDYVSSLGFALGYLGGGLLFLLNVAMTLSPHAFGIADAAQAVRLSFLSVALWWGGFTLFIAFWVPERAVPPAAGQAGHALAAGFRQLAGTLKKIRHLKTVLLFLLSYWFYIDGVDTIIRMAVDYGLSLGFESTDLIKALLIVQFVGFPAALVFGKLGERWGARKSIFLAHRDLHGGHGLGHPDDEPAGVLHHGHGHWHGPGRDPGPEPFLLLPADPPGPGGGILRVLQHARQIRDDCRADPHGCRRPDRAPDAHAGSAQRRATGGDRSARLALGHRLHPGPLPNRSRPVLFRG